MQIHLSDEQLKVVMAALEVFISREQNIADEQGLAVTADQESAEALLESLEQVTAALWTA
jgi:hypothetical protein